MTNKFNWSRTSALAAFFIVLIGTQSVFSNEAPFSIYVGGPNMPGGEWTADQLQKQFAGEITPIEYTGHGQKHTYRCIPLLSVLKVAGAPTVFKMEPKADPKMKSYPLRFAVVARGRDEYVVAFSLAELLPDVGGRHVWVAIDEDGQPISIQDGPIRLLSPDDQKPARSVHQLVNITIVDTAAATTRPASAP
jgi:hypothetical protein